MKREYVIILIVYIAMHLSGLIGPTLLVCFEMRLDTRSLLRMKLHHGYLLVLAWLTFSF